MNIDLPLLRKNGFTLTLMYNQTGQRFVAMQNGDEKEILANRKAQMTSIVYTKVNKQ